MQRVKLTMLHYMNKDVSSFRDEDQTRPREVEHIAGVVTGLVNDANWNTTKQEVDFFYLKGIVANLLHELGVTNEAYQATAGARYASWSDPLRSMQGKLT